MLQLIYIFLIYTSSKGRRALGIITLKVSFNLNYTRYKYIRHEVMYLAERSGKDDMRV